MARDSIRPRDNHAYENGRDTVRHIRLTRVAHDFRCGAHYQKMHLNERGLAYPGITKLTVEITVSIANYAPVLIPVSCVMVLGGVVLGRHIQPTPPRGRPGAIRVKAKRTTGGSTAPNTRCGERTTRAVHAHPCVRQAARRKRAVVPVEGSQAHANTHIEKPVFKLPQL